MAVHRGLLDGNPAGGFELFTAAAQAGGCRAAGSCPGPNYQFAPGCWVYRETRYVWRPGFWYPYRPNWIYTPAHYSWTPYGYVFVDGYWDYPLRQRGLLFAPVAFNVAVYSRPAFVYRPAFVVYDDFLYGALFVRPGGGYVFGDYYDARYRNQGYHSWVNVSVGVGDRDPLFAYYSAANGHSWAVGIGGLYVERTNNVALRPARTLVQQNVVVNNITNNTIVNNNTTVVNNVKNVTAVAPITNVNKTQVVNLTKVTPAQQQAADRACHRNSASFRSASEAGSAAARNEWRSQAGDSDAAANDETRSAEGPAAAAGQSSPAAAPDQVRKAGDDPAHADRQLRPRPRASPRRRLAIISRRPRGRYLRRRAIRRRRRRARRLLRQWGTIRRRRRARRRRPAAIIRRRRRAHRRPAATIRRRPAITRRLRRARRLPVGEQSAAALEGEQPAAPASAIEGSTAPAAEERQWEGQG